MSAERENSSQTPAPRVPLRFDVEYRRSYARSGEKGILKNVSLSGAFLECGTDMLSPKDKVTLEFMVGGRTRKLNATVVWMSSAGAGVVFHHFNNRDLQIIDDLIYFVESKRSKRRNVLDSIFKKVS
jgi:hypothetical protein